MSVKQQEARLCQAAIGFARNPTIEKSSLLSAALDYARAKFSALNRRDKWKRKTRMGE